jgi:hypothetical protein
MSHYRSWRYGQHSIKDTVTGMFRSPGDVGRSGMFGPQPYTIFTKNRNLKLTSRCHTTCDLCRGTSPGCLPGDRKERNQENYASSVSYIVDKMKISNGRSMNKIAICRSLSCLSYLQVITSSRTLAANSFHLYFNQDVWITPSPSYPSFEVAFQNWVSSEPYFTWQREKRCVVISKRQKKKLVCLSGIGQLLSKRLAYHPSAYYEFKSLKNSILKWFFGQDSVRQLIKAGGLNWEELQRIRSFYYFDYRI